MASPVFVVSDSRAQSLSSWSVATFLINQMWGVEISRLPDISHILFSLIFFCKDLHYTRVTGGENRAPDSTPPPPGEAPQRDSEGRTIPRPLVGKLSRSQPTATPLMSFIFGHMWYKKVDTLQLSAYLDAMYDCGEDY